VAGFVSLHWDGKMTNILSLETISILEAMQLVLKLEN
jgi:hypothetical protein